LKPLPPVSPVFSHRYEALAFVTFCILSLLAPFVLPKIVPLESRYEAIPWNLGNYTFIREQIFEQEGPIDILFLGPSAVWTGIDPTLVQEALRERYKRDATALNFGVDFYGNEQAYFLLRDTLLTRRVRLVVLGAPSPSTSAPHLVTPYLLDLHRDRTLLSSLPISSWPAFYAAAVLGAPRQLLSFLRPNQQLTAHGQGKHAVSRIGNGQHYDTRALEDVAVPSSTPLSPHPSKDVNGDVLSKGDPRILETAPSLHQEKILQAIERLCRQSGTGLVLLRVPLQSDEADVIRLPSTELLGGRLKLIAPRPEFATLPPADRAPYYRNAGHLNYRGAFLFTRNALPALLRMYEEHAN
jgi:hypothetical protein